MHEWVRKQRGWHFCPLPWATWTARKSRGKWYLYCQPIDGYGKVERCGEFPRLAAAKKYMNAMTWLRNAD